MASGLSNPVLGYGSQLSVFRLAQSDSVSHESDGIESRVTQHPYLIETHMLKTLKATVARQME
eukprot:11467253-Ditylum_brightwellii.AAC.1